MNRRQATRMRPPIAKVLILASTLALALASGGCLRADDVNKLAILDMLAIDAAEGGRLRVTAQIIIPSQLGISAASGGGRSTSAPFYVVEVVASSIPEALSLINKRVPRTVFLGHLQFMVIGEELAKQGLFPVVDFLVRGPEVRPDLIVAVTPGDAGRLLHLSPPLPTVAGTAWRELVVSERLAVTSARNFVVALGEAGMDPFLTAIAPTLVGRLAGEPEQGDVDLVGVGLFKDDRLVGYLNREETLGLALMTGERTRIVVSLSDQGVRERLGVDGGSAADSGGGRAGEASEMQGVIALDYLSGKSAIRPEGYDPPTLSMEARIQMDILSVSTELDVESPEVSRAIEAAIADEMSRRVMTALHKMQAVNSDAAGLGSKFRRYRSEWWKAMEPHWDDLFQQIQLELDVRVDLLRTGLATRPVGIGEGQLKLETDRGPEQ